MSEQDMARIKRAARLAGILTRLNPDCEVVVREQPFVMAHEDGDDTTWVAIEAVIREQVDGMEYANRTIVVDSTPDDAIPAIAARMTRELDKQIRAARAEGE